MKEKSLFMVLMTLWGCGCTAKCEMGFDEQGNFFTHTSSNCQESRPMTRDEIVASLVLLKKDDPAKYREVLALDREALLVDLAE